MIDRVEAQRMLDALHPNGTFTFQTFDESQRKRSTLSKVLHGRLADCFEQLQALNEAGAGVFVMVNEGDGQGRAAKNVTRVRALFVDLDGAPLEPAQLAALKPHLMLETSPSRYHAYWLVTEWPLPAFKHAQQALAERFGGDPAVCDPARVMRLAGFLHRKADPHRSRVLATPDRPAYRPQEVALAFQINPAVTATRKAPILAGSRNDSLLRFASSLRQRGFSLERVIQSLASMNSEQCRPPLPEAEVKQIAASAMRYPVDGFVSLSRAELASEGYRRASFAARSLYFEAKRQFDSTNGGRISLTEADLRDRGFKNKKILTRAKRECLALGLLAVARPACYGEAGKKRQCALYSMPLGVESAPKQRAIRGQKDTPVCFKQIESFQACGTHENQDDGAYVLGCA